MPQDAPNSSRPVEGGGSPTARAAAAIVLLQAALLIVGSVVLAVAGFRPETVDRLGAEVLAAIGVASGVALALLARGVAGAQRWSRSPVLVLEIISLPIAWTIVQNDKWFAGVPLGVSAAAVLVLMAKSGQLMRADD